MRFAPLLILLAASAAQAQGGADPMKAQADAMRAAWKKSPTKPIGVTLPLYGRVLAFDLIRNFIPAHQAKNEKNFILEFLPDGENFQTWSRMITVTSEKGGANGQLAHAALAKALFDSEEGCDKNLFYTQISERKLGDGVSAVIISRGCAQVAANAYPGALQMGEQNLIVHLRDAQNSYAVQFAVRGFFADGKPTFTGQDVEKQLARFGTIKLCPADRDCDAELKLGQ